MVRAVAGHDFDRAQTIARWPLVELLHAYTHRLKERALGDHRHAMSIWAATVRLRKNRQAPKPPAILSED